uniref:Uncharacterized protein n=1 Tax=Megaselia scalaris TaxID=36166 RepID=T1H0U1_MEGSC
MKFAIIFAALFALAIGAPPKQASSSDAQILRLDSDIKTDGFRYALETSDGTSQIAEGQLKQTDPENAAVVQSGSFKFVADDGQTYQVNWTADEFGFHPEGAHLPATPES